MTTIVICYVKGTSSILRVTLDSISRHTQVPVEIVISVASGGIDQELLVLSKDMPIRVVEVPERLIGPNRHGSQLDYVIANEVSTEFILTLDSDAVPISDGWLKELELILSGSNVGTAGILHPWAPPPPDLSIKSVEKRVRDQHCWKTTHVACQLMSTSIASSLIAKGIRFSSGDDTGLAIVKSLKESGLSCLGYRPTRCPIPKTDFDPEHNRLSCVVFGDKILHVGGFTRKSVYGDLEVFGNAFGWARDKILEIGRADFLLDDENSYRYQFDREEEVSETRMQELFGLSEKATKD